MFEPRYKSDGTRVVKPVYREKDSWVLGECKRCGNLNYVEPHGTTAECRSKKCKGEWQEHANLLYEPSKKTKRHRG